MNSDQSRQLCLALLRADSEAEVVEILKRASLWDDRTLWRLYGDKEGNFAAAGNQQAMPEAALVEKIVNSCDARLMCECAVRGIAPESEAAPNSVRDAVAMFFENKRATGDEAGSLANWPRQKRTEQSRFITIAATGGKPTPGQKRRNMCITIADQAEGQSPHRMPKTILSLNEKNKQRIRFVQGKWNMGGTGALRFCGRLGLQLVISRRHPKLAEREQGKDPTVGEWGFTVVRREQPTNQSGDPIHSEFTYLAPIDAAMNPRRGEVLRFSSHTMPLMADKDEAYCREVEFGTAIKLYEYETTVGQSNVLMKDGLMYALERLLPEIALPVRIHECRGYKGEKERSFETPIAGLVVRLEEGKGDNLEEKFPLTVRLNVEGMSMSARIYAFKEKSAQTYLKDEGVIFSLNGQAHGYLPKSIFSRPKAVGLPRLKDSLLVLVDCSALDATHREDLFMSSRDRLSKKPIRFALEREIEQLLKNNPELKRLQQERRESDVSTSLSDEKPLEEVLSRIFTSSPTLKTLFLRGQRLSRPFAGNPNAARGEVGGDRNEAGGSPGAGGGGDGTSPGSGEGKGGGGGLGPDGPQGPEQGESVFAGRRHPTYFRVPKVKPGETYRRNFEEGRRCRIEFETDVENGYFDRAADRGSFRLDVVEASKELPPPSFSLTLEDGRAFLNMALSEDAESGDWFVLQASVSDATLTDPLVSTVRLTVTERQERPAGPPKPRPKKPGSGDGDDSEGANRGASASAPQGIKLPRIVEVHEGDERWIKHRFKPDDACVVVSDPVEVDGRTRLEHTFYVNMDNVSLKTEMKYGKQDARLPAAKFKYGNVLIGLAMLHEAEAKGELDGGAGDEADDRDNDRPSPQELIRRVTSAVSPVMIPIIDQLSGLDDEQLEELSTTGEDA